MKPKTWVRVREVFQAAVELPPAERETFLGAECGHEPEVRTAVEHLLGQDEAAAELFDQGILTAPMLPAEGVEIGTRIGRYTLERVVASGGMGTVFEATQDQPNRRVALKMMRFGLASPGRLRRFQFEAEVLGTLRHPGIAQIFEAGTHETAIGELPFFAMEFVPQARDILSYAAENALTRRQRLELFAQVCGAVSHGHQKGVIHRDLKPGNILVDGDGQPKVIDYGVARATDTDLTAETRTGQLVGTLQYMSPEQLGGERAQVDVRSDVHALGSVLYELLTSAPPYDLEGLPIGAVIRTIRETEPRRPQGLPGDLVWILMKALEKDPHRRYASASEFGSDLERFLHDEPVLAGPPSRRYRLQKFVRRHRAGILGVVAVIVALSVGLVQAQRDARAAERAQASAELALAEAEVEAAKARGVSSFLRRTLSSAAPYDQGGDALVVDVLDEASRRVHEDLADEPEVLAIVQHAIGDSYRAISRFDRAATHLQAARDFVERELSPDDPFAIEVMATVAHQLMEQDLRAADELTAELLPRAERSLGEEHTTVLRIRQVRARTLAQLDRPDEAEPYATTNLEIRRRLNGDGHERLIMPLKVLALVRRKQGRVEEEFALTREVMAICEERLPEDHYQLAAARMKLGAAHFGRTEWVAAEECFRPCLEWFREELGDDHPLTAGALSNLAISLMMQERAEEALPLLEEALPLTKELFGERSLDTLTILCNLAVNYWKRGLLEEAEEICYEALELADGLLPEDHDLLIRVRMNLGVTLEKQERLEEAEEVFRTNWETSRDSRGPAHRVTLAQLSRLVYVQKLRGDLPEWEALAIELRDRSGADGFFREWSEETLAEARAARAER